MSHVKIFNKKGFIFINNFFTKQDLKIITSNHLDERIVDKIKNELSYCNFNNSHIAASLTKNDIFLYDSVLQADEYFGDWNFKKEDLLIHKYSINKGELFNINFFKYRNNYIRV
tara:strand:- start:1437 stop:1778 length:342 start_codon:yes stop_codon:yes gene_type:complete